MIFLQSLPQPGDTQINFPDFIILLGVVQGVILSIAGILHSSRSEKFKSLLYFPITLILLEIFLNRTGYMYFVIQLVDFSEPFQFLVPPALYLIIRSTGEPGRSKNWWIHTTLFLAYLVFLIPVYTASQEFKEQSYYYMHHPSQSIYRIDDRLLLFVNRLRGIQLTLFAIQSAVYLVLCGQLLVSYRRHNRLGMIDLAWWTFFCIIFGVLLLFVLVVKNFFLRDLGDHLIAWFLTAILFLGTIRELMRSGMPTRPLGQETDEERKSRMAPLKIDPRRMEEIRVKLESVMEEKRIYTDNLVSLGKVARLVNEPSYVVSYVLNEIMGCTFFEWIGRYRIEEAKRFLGDESKNGFTIEQIAEDVGYNSKSAFNKAFRKITGKTPSDYKKSLET